MNSRRFIPWSAGLLLVGLLVSAAAADDEQPFAFPFEAEVDAAAGRTGELPNRVRVKELDLWLRLVPAGRYAIGDDELPDSRRIEVKLDAYYIAENELRPTQHLQLELRRAADAAVWLTSWMRDDVEITPDQQTALRLLIESELLTTELDPVVPESLRSECESLAAEVQREFGTADDMEVENLEEFLQRLSEVDPERVRDLKGRVEKQLAKLLEFAATNEGAKPAAVERFAVESLTGTWLNGRGPNLRLPTEAEWEVAARLAADGKLAVAGMLDQHLEWCADFYDHEYFDRSKDFANPRGPEHGRLSDEQRKVEKPNRRRSSLPWRVVGRVFLGRWDRGYRVVRGEGTAARGFGNDREAAHAIRFVYRPGPNP